MRKARLRAPDGWSSDIAKVSPDRPVIRAHRAGVARSLDDALARLVSAAWLLPFCTLKSIEQHGSYKGHPVSLKSMSDAPRRYLLGTAKKLLFDNEPKPSADPADDFPRLTPSALERISMSRSRERIMDNLDTMYREAFERAKSSTDDKQMAALDFAYRREQLYLEILLDIREAAERR